MTDILATLAKLPELCAARLPTDNSPILIRRGSAGYWPFRPDLDVEAFNAHHGISTAQVEAMLCGSMFGWDSPAADPENPVNRPPLRRATRSPHAADRPPGAQARTHRKRSFACSNDRDLPRVPEYNTPVAKEAQMNKQLYSVVVTETVTIRYFPIVVEADSEADAQALAETDRCNGALGEPQQETVLGVDYEATPTTADADVPVAVDFVVTEAGGAAIGEPA